MVELDLVRITLEMSKEYTKLDLVRISLGNTIKGITLYLSPCSLSSFRTKRRTGSEKHKKHTKIISWKAVYTFRGYFSIGAVRGSIPI